VRGCVYDELMTMTGQKQSLFQRSLPTRLMYGLGKMTPPALAGGVVWGITQALLAWKPANYYGALANLSHVLPAESTQEDHVRAVRRLFYYSTLSYYHLFHNAGRRDLQPEEFRPSVQMPAEVRGYLEDAVATGRGLMVLGSHSSNFDLCGIAFAHYAPVPVQALSLADPPPGYQIINDLRSRARGTLTPITPQTLREAIERLRSGGIVLTGVDRPVPGANSPVTFFGQPACLPTGYIRIPLITDCLVMTLSFVWDGVSYRIRANPPMEMERTGDRERDVVVNVQRVLAQIEDFVRAAPDQWMVFLPVWDNSCRS